MRSDGSVRVKFGWSLILSITMTCLSPSYAGCVDVLLQNLLVLKTQGALFDSMPDDPKAQMAVRFARAGLKVPPGPFTLRTAQARHRPFIIRSESRWENLFSGIATSYPVFADSDPRQRLQVLNEATVTQFLSGAINQDDWLSSLRRTTDTLVESLGITAAQLADSTQFSNWEYISGTNVTVFEDSGSPGTFYVFVWGGLAGASFRMSENHMTQFAGMPTTLPEALILRTISIYQRARNAEGFNPSHPYVAELQIPLAVDEEPYALQLHPTRDPSPSLIHVGPNVLKPRDATDAYWSRGATSPLQHEFILQVYENRDRLESLQDTQGVILASGGHSAVQHRLEGILRTLPLVVIDEAPPSTLNHPLNAYHPSHSAISLFSKPEATLFAETPGFERLGELHVLARRIRSPRVRVQANVREGSGWILPLSIIWNDREVLCSRFLTTPSHELGALFGL